MLKCLALPTSGRAQASHSSAQIAPRQANPTNRLSIFGSFGSFLAKVLAKLCDFILQRLDVLELAALEGLLRHELIHQALVLRQKLIVLIQNHFLLVAELQIVLVQRRILLCESLVFLHQLLIVTSELL